MAFLAPLFAAVGTFAAEAGAAMGIGSGAAAGAAGTGAAAGTAFSGIAGASAAGAAGAAGAGAGAAAAGLTAGEMAALGLTAAGIGTTLLSPGMPKMDMPATEKAKVMPLSDDQAMLDAKRKAMVAQQQRQGRASTMLSGGGDSLGGSSL